MSHHDSKSKVNLPMIAITAIFAIVLITIMTISFSNKFRDNSSVSNADLSGQASFIAKNTDNTNGYFCKLIVGRTTLYDDTTLAVTLKNGESTYYSGYSVTVSNINSEGCVVNINGDTDYLAVGQVQKLSNVYVTVKDASAR